jgi:signal transduction histidine kinase
LDIDSIKTFFESRRYPVAILDPNFRIVWSNSDRFFCVGKSLTDDISFRTEEVDLSGKVAGIQIEGEAMPVFFTPLTEDGEITGYVCEIYTAQQIAQLGIHSGLKNKALSFLRIMNSNISHVINIAVHLENIFANEFKTNEITETPEKKQKLLRYQQSSACKALLQIMNMSSVFETGAFLSTSEITIGLNTIENIINETNEIIKRIGRKIVFTKLSDLKYHEIVITPRKFTIVFMNLLQNALFYSPPKSDIIVTVKLEKHKTTKDEEIMIINIENDELPEEEKEQIEERAGLGLDIVGYISEQYNGTVELIRNDKRVNAKIAFPATQFAAKRVLSSNFKTYVSERFKPVRLFADEAVEREIRNNQGQ